MQANEQLAAVISSEYRKQVLDALETKAKTPSQIAEETDIDISHVSREVCGTLGDMDLVELIVPEETQKGRLYAITEDGETVLERMGEIGGDEGE